MSNNASVTLPIPQRVGLLDFIKTARTTQFVVPVYQRYYTWTPKKETQRFLDDFKKIIDGKYNSHFMGIIIYLSNEISFNQAESLIIDGQQRLTTTFLLLQAIKKIMMEKNVVGGADSIKDMYLNLPSYDSRKYKLLPQVSDDNVYRYIADDIDVPTAEQDSNIYENYMYIYEFLKSVCENKSIEEVLSELNKLSIVCVPILPSDNPQKVFESINATGAKLTASDLIRNYVLMDLSSNRQEIYYKTFWEKIEKLIAKDSKKLEAFFRFFLMAKRRRVINKVAVYDEFVNWFESEISASKKERDEVKDYLFLDIGSYAEAYNTIYVKPLDRNKGSLTDRKFSAAILEFRRVLSDMPAPFFLELIQLKKSGKITDEAVTEIFDITTNYLMRRSLCDLDTSGITRLFPTLLGNILEECGNNFSNIVTVFKKHLIVRNKGNAMYMPDNFQVHDLLFNTNMYALRVSLKAFFEKYETSDDSAINILNDLSIEHLMPQTPTDEWLDVLGVDADTYERNLHRLGNLTLATKPINSKMSNKVWSYKKDLLESTSELRLNKKLYSIERWTIDCIDERTEELIKEICRLYPYPDVNNIDLEKIEIHLASTKLDCIGYFSPEDGSVEIQVGSEIEKNKLSEKYSDIRDLRQELLDEHIIEQTDKGFVFVKPYTFYKRNSSKKDTALSFAASFVFYGSKDGWKEWVDMNNKTLDSDPVVAKRFSRKVNIETNLFEKE